ncbi:MAG: carbon starvation protein A [Andreesenia angusta]|nr:carbon starvation protein A [Andreesenia angusta]
MRDFILGIIILIVGYFTYSKIVERVFEIDQVSETPAIRLQDNVDYVPMKPAKIFLIQLLNIAGLGPIFGAIQGALFGPAAFLWIAFGTILAGGVHDYFSGMMSLRHNGKSISEISGIYLGQKAKKVMRVFSVVLLVLTGTVFMTGPAQLLQSLGLFNITSLNIWLAIIFIYYILATIVPVDKIIGRIYPLFGATLIIMALGVGIGLVVQGYKLPDFTLHSTHPKGLPIWAMLFTTIACGAISGFHATQSPMMARCLTNERYGRPIFYGAMVTEGIIAMVWAAAGMAFFNGIPELGRVLDAAGPGGAIREISFSIMGSFGGILAMIGVIICPITSGDTAFRSARLTIADALDRSQRTIQSRIAFAAPLFIIAFLLTRIDFQIIWRYFAFSNQALATIALWTGSSFLSRNNKAHWLTTLPAIFMTAVCSTYILQAPEGFRLNTSIAYPLGLAIAIIISIMMLILLKKQKGVKVVDQKRRVDSIN